MDETTWVTITEDDVLSGTAGRELAAYRTRALAQGQDDPLPQVVSKVIGEVRGFVAGCPENKLGAPGLIPSRLLPAAVDLVIYRLTNRLGLAVKEDRRTAYREARELLRQVARCEFAIDDPDLGDVGAGPGAEVVNRPNRVADKEQLGGLT